MINLYFIIIRCSAQIPDTLLYPKDTVYLSLENAENLFLQQNFQLLAEKYNVDAAKLTVIQAKLHFNPVVYFEHTLYNPQNHKLFDRSKNGGEVVTQVQQLIRLAGKRSKLVRQAEINASLETLAFEDLLRVLRFQLHSDYINIYYNLKTLNILKNEERQLDQLLKASSLQYNVGAISGYELIRIEYELQNVRTEIRDNLVALLNVEEELKMMLQMQASKFIIPVPIIPADTPKYELEASLDSAYKNRPDYRASLVELDFRKQTLLLEKANAVPDLLMGATYDRLGGAYRNYTGVSAQINIPIFYRNQGNIKIAKARTELAEKGITHSELLIQQDVINSLDQMIINRNIYKSYDTSYKENLKNISAEAVLNYQRRVIGLLDFIDKMRTYKNGMLNIMDAEMNFWLSRQYFNFVTNTKFY